MSVNQKRLLDHSILDEILDGYDSAGLGELIPILQKIQESYGYLDRDILMKLSRRTGIAASKIYGVATFYEQFYLAPHGRHTIKCCRGTACHVNRGTEIIDVISGLLKVQPGQSTEDMRFTFETVACLGTCFLAPVIMVDNDYYGNLKPSQIEDILKKYE